MMGVARMRAAAHWKRHWLSLVTLALIVAVVGAAVFTAAAGARRTKSVPSRFLTATRSGDVAVMLQRHDFRGAREIMATPGIEASGRLAMMAMLPERPLQSYAPLNASVDGTVGTSFEKGLLIEGRRPRPDSFDEVALSAATAQRMHASVGDVVRYWSLSPSTYACSRAQPPTCPDALDNPDGPKVALRVVGIVRLATDLLATESTVTGSYLPPGFFAHYRGRIGYDAMVLVRLRPGTSETEFVAHARRSLPAGVDAVFNAFHIPPLRDSANVAAFALWVFAAVAAAAGIFVIGQAVARDVAAADGDAVALHAMGMTRATRVVDRVLPVLPAALAGALVAVIGAYVASATMPLGTARLAEPDRGRSFDAAVLLGGALVVFAVVLVVAVAAAQWRERRAPGPVTRRRSWAARRASDAGLPAPAVTGLGMAFDGGQGRASSAARSAILGCAVGVTGVVAVLGFAAALSHLYGTPRLYGWGNIEAADIEPGLAPTLRNDGGVRAIADVEIEMDLRVDGIPVNGFAMRALKGTARPSLESGRAPAADDEVALGRHTLQMVHASVGDRVRVAGTEREATLRVVGVAVFPATDDGLAIAEGAMVTMTTAHRIGFGAGQHILGVQLEAHDRDVVLRKIARMQHRAAALPAAPAEVTKLRQVDRLPRVLALVLAVLALLATGHALFIAVRRRGYELAVLRVLGFRPRQVASAVAWQGTAMVVAGAIIGIPLGILLGRIAWGMTAHTIGVLSVYRLPVAALGLIVPASIVVSVLLAWLPARRAARLAPATILRSE